MLNFSCQASRPNVKDKIEKKKASDSLKEKKNKRYQSLSSWTTFSLLVTAVSAPVS